MQSLKQIENANVLLMSLIQDDVVGSLSLTTCLLSLLSTILYLYY